MSGRSRLRLEAGFKTFHDLKIWIIYIMQRNAIRVMPYVEVRI